jgi:serine/threonine protein kinase
MTGLASRFESIDTVMREANLSPLSNGIIYKPKWISHDFESLMKRMKIEEIKYIKSGSTGSTFCLVSPTTKFALKIVAYPKKTEFGDSDDPKRPENVEIDVLKLLSSMVETKYTPHLILPVVIFDLDAKSLFSSSFFKNMESSDSSKYIKLLTDFKNNKIYNVCSCIISEWADMGDLLQYLRDHVDELSELDWKVLFFQLLYTLSVIQKYYPTFRHNDLKPNNILLSSHRTAKKGVKYSIDDVSFKLPVTGVSVRIWDFDFACIGGMIDNAKVNLKWAKEEHNISAERNHYYDMHYFFNTLSNQKFGSYQFMMHPSIPANVKDFCSRIVPKTFPTSKNGRIMCNEVYTTPKKVMLSDPLFNQFRCSNNTI